MPVHDGRPVIEQRLVLVVRPAAELDAGWLVPGAPRPVVHVVKLELMGRGASSALAVDEGAAAAIARPHQPAYRRGDVARSCTTRARSLDRFHPDLIGCGPSFRSISGGLGAVLLEIRQVFLRCSRLTRPTSSRALEPRFAHVRVKAV